MPETACCRLGFAAARSMSIQDVAQHLKVTLGSHCSNARVVIAIAPNFPSHGFSSAREQWANRSLSRIHTKGAEAVSKARWIVRPWTCQSYCCGRYGHGSHLRDNDCRSRGLIKRLHCGGSRSTALRYTANRPRAPSSASNQSTHPGTKRDTANTCRGPKRWASCKILSVFLHCTHLPPSPIHSPSSSVMYVLQRPKPHATQHGVAMSPS